MQIEKLKLHLNNLFIVKSIKKIIKIFKIFKIDINLASHFNKDNRKKINFKHLNNQFVLKTIKITGSKKLLYLIRHLLKNYKIQAEFLPYTKKTLQLRNKTKK